MRWPEARAAALSALLVLAAGAPVAARDDEAEYLKAATTIRCDCGCHPQSVHDCACPRAAEMRAELRARLAQGMSGAAVIADYVARFGEQIRIAPEARGFSLLAWLGPLAALLVACGGLLALVRRWSRRAAPALAAPLGGAPGVAADDPHLARLRSELEELR